MTTAVAPRLSGTVLKFDANYCWGFITGNDRRLYFVHRRDVEDYPTLLRPGEVVTFVPGESSRGPWAAHVMRAAAKQVNA